MKNYKLCESFVALKSLELEAAILSGKPLSDEAYGRYKESLDWLFLSGYYTMQENKEKFNALIELHLDFKDMEVSA